MAIIQGKRDRGQGKGTVVALNEVRNLFLARQVLVDGSEG
jgi:hypothetical protein